MPKTASTTKSNRKSKAGSPKPAKSLAKKALLRPIKKNTEPLDKKPPKKLPSVYKLTREAAEFAWRYKEIFFGICLVYGVLNLVLVQGLTTGSNVTELKSEVKKTFSGHLGSVGTSAGVYIELLGSAGNGSSNTAGAYQVVLFIVVSLALIWSLRQIHAGKIIRIRDAYYNGMNQLVPFVLVILVLFAQLIPLIIGGSLYGISVNNGVALNLFEKLIFLFIFLGFATWSIYLISATLFGVYIVTLPDMTPLKAIRSAKALVKKRRLLVIRKIIALPFILIVASAIVMIPIIIVATFLAKWVFFIITTLMLLAVHSYLYNLYREMLNDQD